MSFVLVAAAVYFFVVTPMNMLAEKRKRGEVPAIRRPKVQGVPERRADRGAPLRVLHAVCCSLRVERP